MKHMRQIVAALVITCIVISLSACGDGTAKKSDSENKKGQKGSMGRFVEEELTLPEGEFYSMNTLTDGRMRVLCSTGIYDSADKGETWVLWDSQPDEFTEDLTAGEEQETEDAFMIERSIRGSVIGKDGALFYHVEEDGMLIYKYMDKNGKITHFAQEDSRQVEQTMEWMMQGMSFTDAGDFLYVDKEGYIVLLDCTSNTVKHTFEAQASFAVSVGDRLFVISNNISGDNIELGSDAAESVAASPNNIELTVYSLTTYEKVEESTALSDFLTAEADKEEGILDLSLMEGEDGKSIYLVNESGIYRYMVNGSVVEKIFNGDLGRMNSSQLSAGAVLDKDHLVFVYYKARDVELVRYSFDPDIPSVPENEITVYSLYDNYGMRAAITKFQEKNPDVYVVYDVALDGDTGMTAGDAIKILNTNIVAGEGPDVLVLEGMPVDSYQEKGLLMDISDVLQEVSETDGLFENIAYTYEKDGKVQAVPTRFSVPVIMGKKESLAKISDFESFLHLAEEQHRNGTASVFTSMDSYSLLRLFLTASSPVWVQDNGSLDTKALKEFLTGVQRLADFNPTPPEDRWGTEMEEGLIFDLTQFMTTGECYLQQLLEEDTDLNVFQMKDRWNLFKVTSVIKQLGAQEYTYAAAPGQASDTFVPIDSVGISAKSQDTETAKRFLKWLVGSDNEIAVGWPINKKAYADGMIKENYVEEGIVEVVNEDGAKWNYNNIWPDKTDFDEFSKLVESLDTPSVSDEIVNKTVLEEGSEFLKGQKTVDEAVDHIMSRLNLYLAE